MSSLLIPLEILAKIATQDYGHVYREMLAVPQFARFVMCNREYVERQMILTTHDHTSASPAYNTQLLGQFHSVDDKPAIVFENTQEWWTYGKRNRCSNIGPAVIRAGHSREWWQNGMLHRSGDLPARIWDYGAQEWYQNGECHRDGDQPAVTLLSYIHQWYQNGKLHRDGDQPADINTDISQFWYQHGELHRDDDQLGPRPAKIYKNGYKEYFKHGKFYDPYSVGVPVS